MPELLLELFSEEIPARMQAKASEDLKKLMLAGMAEAGLAHGQARAFATPRRLTLVIDEVAKETDAVREEIKGPRTDAPAKALEGFLRKTGLSEAQLEKRDDKKGQVYFAVIEKPAQKAEEIIAAAAVKTVENFPWPKSMRWGEGELRWVRPLRSILCLFSDGDERHTPAFEVGGVRSGAVTYGHRFLNQNKKTGAPKEIKPKNFTDYVAQLAKAKVTLDPATRTAEIEAKSAELAQAKGLEFVADPALLREVAGLVELPVPLMGAIDPEFQQLPPEVLQTSMREHQKYFSLRTPDTGKIVKFIAVSNMEATDGGAKILAGNERVLRARLSDARFFYDNDLAKPLEKNVEKLANVTFHNQLGSQAARIARVEALAKELAPIVGAKPAAAARAARLAKADLASEMVYEFPELQGVMGRYYALAAKEKAEVADAIAEHYAPAGPSDEAPRAPVSIAVALADKLDQLACFWAIGAKPTGSGDPFALRRAALGVIRIILENGLRLEIDKALAAHAGRVTDDALGDAAFADDARADLMGFFADRLKVWLRDQGVRHDVVDAVYRLTPPGQPIDDFSRAKARIDALSRLIGSDDGANLLAAYKRANNILTAEEAKDGVEYSLDPEPKLAEHAAEKALFAALDAAEKTVRNSLDKENDADAMAAMAELRQPLDAFFEDVVVNADKAIVRRNRLCLLNRIRVIMGRVGDLSAIEG
ncbi:MAG: glycine--tRNA ligase subunit beta [Neomegalonema sp.]|nr:glycine--tRNA ligase subunit beta [Neomegalonema sp.]